MWLVLALLVAVLTSLQDILSKHVVHKVDATLVTWGWWFFSLPFLYGALLFAPLPPLGRSFWSVLFFATLLDTIAVIYYIKAIRFADLSLSIPMLSFTPLLLLITSPVMLQEFPRLTGIFGVLGIVLGSYMLHFRERRFGFWMPWKSIWTNPGSRYMLGVAVLFSLTGNLDKMGVLNSSPLLWIVSINTTIVIALSALLHWQKQEVVKPLKYYWRMLLPIGLINGLALGVQMTILPMTQVPYLIAIKRTSVILSVLYGFIFLKEAGFRERMVGILLMILGVFLISWG